MGQKILKDGKKRRKKGANLEITDFRGSYHKIPPLKEILCKLVDINAKIEGFRTESKFEMTWKDKILEFYVPKSWLMKEEIIKQASARFASAIYDQHLVKSDKPIRDRTMSRAVRRAWLKQKAKAWDALMEEVESIKIIDEVMSS